MPIADYWKLVLTDLEQTVSVGKYQAWLQNLEFISTGERNTVINLTTISRFAKEYIEKKLEKPLLLATQKYFPKITKINLKVRQKLIKTEELACNKIENHGFRNNPKSRNTNGNLNQNINENINKFGYFTNDFDKDFASNSEDNSETSKTNFTAFDHNFTNSIPNSNSSLNSNKNSNSSSVSNSNSSEKTTKNTNQNFENSFEQIKNTTNYPANYSTNSAKKTKIKTQLDGQIDKSSGKQEIFNKEKLEKDAKIEFEKKDWQVNSLQTGNFPTSNLNNLNSKYNFENLVTSDYNELAVSVAKSVLKQLGTLYNPVFIHSRAGLGKTHLLQAIGQKALENDPTLRIKYVTCETFFNHYLLGIQKNQSSEFRRYYRDLDLLLLDDIQFINGKNSTQEAFFHTFNELHQQNKQIIITSDKHPDELGLIEDRLVSRFKWGMVVDLSNPNLEDRLAILKDKLERQNLQLENPQILQIAQKITTNIRELEGIVNQIKMKIQISGKIDQNWLDETLDKNDPKNQEKNLPGDLSINSTDRIIQLVAQNYKINSRQIVSQNRDKKTSEARQLVMYIWHKNFGLSLGVVARMLGKKNHTTVLHGVSKIQKELDKNKELKDRLEQIIQNIS